jgi:hypothetical protein
MIVTALVLGAVLLSIFGIIASFIPQRRVLVPDDGSIDTAAQLDAAIVVQRALQVAELQRRMTDRKLFVVRTLGIGVSNADRRACGRSSRTSIDCRDRYIARVRHRIDGSRVATSIRSASAGHISSKWAVVAGHPITVRAPTWSLKEDGVNAYELKISDMGSTCSGERDIGRLYICFWG